MAKVINLVRRSEVEFILEEEVTPGQWISVAHVPQAAVTTEKPRQLFGVRTEAIGEFLSNIGAFFKPDPIRVAATQLRPPGVGPPGPLIEFVEPPRAPVLERPAAQRKIAVTPEQLTRLAVETKIREQQIKNYLATPLGFVFQESKKFPGVVTQVPIERPTPPPGEIEALFPRPTLPISQELAGLGPTPARVFKGFVQVEGGRRLNLWEDFAGNEVEGFRDQPGEFGQVEQILEF